MKLSEGFNFSLSFLSTKVEAEEEENKRKKYIKKEKREEIGKAKRPSGGRGGLLGRCIVPHSERNGGFMRKEGMEDRFEAQAHHSILLGHKYARLRISEPDYKKI